MDKDLDMGMEMDMMGRFTLRQCSRRSVSLVVHQPLTFYCPFLWSYGPVLRRRIKQTDIRFPHFQQKNIEKGEKY